MSYRLNLDFVRGRKAEFMRRIYSELDTGKSDLEVKLMHDIVVAPRDDNNRYEDNLYSADNCKEHLPLLDGIFLYAGHLDRHWGHFLMDSLSRLWPAFDSETPHFDKIIFTVDKGWPESYHPNIHAALQSTGLSDKIEIIANKVIIKTLIVPDRAFLPRERFSPKALKVYDAMADAVMRLQRKGESAEIKEGNKRIYFSRSHLKKSRLNEPFSDWLDKYFADNGFEVVMPESLDFGSLIRKIRGADIVASLSGTIPHNMIFANEGAKLWIIDKSPIINNYQPGVDILRNLHTTYIDSNAFLMPVDSGVGPFIIYPNKKFAAFAHAMGLDTAKPWSLRIKKKAMRRYIKMHRRHYNYRLMIQEWEESEIGSMREAYKDSYIDFRPFIERRIPLTLSDALSPRLIVKRLKSKFKQIL